MSGPAINYNGSYASPIKLLHTFDTQKSALYRMHPILNNQLATQELNERGLYPTGNQRFDVSGPYPANIEMKRKDTPECNQVTQQCGSGKPGCCQSYSGSYDRYGPGRACNSCCPGFKATPMSEIVARTSCSSCSVPAVEPRIADGGLGTMSRYQVQRYEASNGYGCGGCASGWGQSMTGYPSQASSCYSRDNPSCCASMGQLVDRPCCSKSGARALPYPYYNYNEDDAVYSAGMNGYAGRVARGKAPSSFQMTTANPIRPSNLVEPIAPSSPFLKAKNGADMNAVKEADAINISRTTQAEAETRALAAQVQQMAQQMKVEATQAASAGQMGAAAEKQAAANKFEGVVRQVEQMADQVKQAVTEANKASKNGDSNGVLDKVQAGLKTAGGAMETAVAALGQNGTA